MPLDLCLQTAAPNFSYVPVSFMQPSYNKRRNGFLNNNSGYNSGYVSSADSDETASDSELLDPFGADAYICRRVSSFPLINSASKDAWLPQIPSMRSRSSEHICIESRNKLNRLSLDEVKQELTEFADLRMPPLSPTTPPCPPRKSSSTVSLPTTPISESKTKRRVVFADDRGRNLFTIKIMTEPSDMPPKFSDDLLRSILGEDAVPKNRPPASTWVAQFSQPACEYLKFRATVEKQGVSLENVLIKNNDNRLIGTIKVKNLAFEKEVLVRVTDNNWNSSTDHKAEYVHGPKGELYDTFRFDFGISGSSEEKSRLEFCIAYKSGAGDGLREFWDSNDGKNYVLLSEEAKNRMKKPGQRQAAPSYINSDAYAYDCSGNWAQFSAWNDLETFGPYY